MAPANLLPSPVILSYPSLKVLIGILPRQSLSYLALSASKIPLFFISSKYFLHFCRASLGFLLAACNNLLIAPVTLLPSPFILSYASLSTLDGIFSKQSFNYLALNASNNPLFFIS
jgi:hypothetical protein